jgi:hypothetical protein
LLAFTALELIRLGFLRLGTASLVQILLSKPFLLLNPFLAYYK